MLLRLLVLSEEIVARLEEDYGLWCRRAKTLTVHHRPALRPDHLQKWLARQVDQMTPERARQGPMPAPPSGSNSTPVPRVAQVVSSARALLQRLEQEGEQPMLPCTRIALTATDLYEVPSGDACITRFFATPAASKPANHVTTVPFVDAEADITISDSDVEVVPEESHLEEAFLALRAILGEISVAQARSLLKESGNDVSAAVSLFFDKKDDLRNREVVAMKSQPLKRKAIPAEGQTQLCFASSSRRLRKKDWPQA
eukprot:6461473-Amphidinium_carterae.1